MLHETVVTDGIASMPHAMSVPVPAGQSVALAPGGYHGMLMGLTNAFKEGDSFPVTMTFEKAGEVTVTVDGKEEKFAVTGREWLRGEATAG